MILATPQTKKFIDDYDIILSTGVGVTYTIDVSIGDSIHMSPEVIRIVLAAKPSQADPLKMLPAEDSTIFMRYVASIQHRRREVVELTPEERFEQMKAWQSYGANSSVQ